MGTRITEINKERNTSLTVTFWSEAQQARFELKMYFRGTSVSIKASRHFLGGNLDLPYVVFELEEFYEWIRKDPMFNNGGFYGMLEYCIEQFQFPEWVREFKNAMI
jgi:hypothetical protein